MIESLQAITDKTAREFGQISAERKATLDAVVEFIRKRQADSQPAQLVFGLHK